MMRLRRATLLLALFLLTSAATAHGECAWVLWEHRVTPTKEGAPTETWLAREAVETRAVCESKAEALIQRLVEAQGSGGFYKFRRNGRKQRGSSDPRSKEQGGYQTSDFRCLPDTVDPRGAKGK